MGTAEHSEAPYGDDSPVYDPSFTDRVIAATGPNAHPRLVQLMPCLIQHLHDFARETNLTVAEWTAGVEFVSSSHPDAYLTFLASHPNNKNAPRKPYPTLPPNAYEILRL